MTQQTLGEHGDRLKARKDRALRQEKHLGAPAVSRWISGTHCPLVSS
jgi:hypothetical protein